MSAGSVMMAAARGVLTAAAYAATAAPARSRCSKRRRACYAQLRVRSKRNAKSLLTSSLELLVPRNSNKLQQ